MDKVYTYLMIIVGISLFLFLSGLDSGMNMFAMLENITSQSFLSTESILNNPLWAEILIVFGIISAATIYQSVIAGNASAALAIGGITIATFIGVSFLGDIVHILNLASSSCDITGSVLCGVPYRILFVICSLLLIGFIWSLVQLVIGGGD